MDPRVRDFRAREQVGDNIVVCEVATQVVRLSMRVTMAHTGYCLALTGLQSSVRLNTNDHSVDIVKRRPV